MSTNSNPRPETRKDGREDANLDPITGAPGSHPVGAGVGAAAGGAAGLGIGAAVGGPIGAVVGAAAGAVMGGLGGKSIATEWDAGAEELHWRANYRSRPYVGVDEPFDLYLPAYRLGWEHRMRNGNKAASTFDEVEEELSKAWDSVKRTTSLTWDKARYAVRDAWDRLSIERAENEGMPSPHPRGTAAEADSRDRFGRATETKPSQA